MHLRSLRIENFRNIERADLELPARVSLFVGDNGSGKTSLLEAVHLTLTGRSQRRATHDVMLRRDCDFFRLEAQVAFGRTVATAEYGFAPGRKRSLRLNNNPIGSTAQLLSEFAVVSFAPEDLLLAYGPPSVRRAAFDFLLATADAAYLSALTKYLRAVQHKNRILKELQRPSGRRQGTSELEAFNVQIVDLGVQLMEARRNYTAESADVLASVYARLSDGGETAGVRYAPCVDIGQDRTRSSRAFEDALAANAERERMVGMSLIGPHRDDWELSLSGRPARQYASQGQARSLAVALKLAGFRYLEGARGDTPILLFDEIFGELDPGRGRRLLDLVGEFAQALITSVQPDTAAGLGRDADCFDIRGGKVQSRT